MSQSENQGPIKSGFNAIREVLTYATLVVEYILAISGRFPGSFPVSISLIVIIITSIFVLSWRWRAINQQKVSVSGIVLLPNTHPKNQTKDSFLDNLFEPIKSYSNNEYHYSLARRRVESIVLLFITLYGIAWTGSNFQKAWGEFNDSRSLLICDNLEVEKPHRIVIADIQEKVPNNLSLEERLYIFLSHHKDEGQFDVCRLAKEITIDTVEQAATDNGADILIWGLADERSYDIHLEIPAWENHDISLTETPAVNATSMNFQFSVDYLTEFTMSELIFMHGDTIAARERLKKAIDILIDATREHSLDTHANDKSIAQGYFQLGLFYDPGISDYPDAQAAMAYYQQAFTLQDDLHIARLNYAVLLASDGQTQEAIAVFTQLIEKNTPVKCVAYLNRAERLSDLKEKYRDIDNAIACMIEPVDKAQAYFVGATIDLDHDDYSKAMHDLKQAVKLNPKEYTYYNMLGMTQLDIGELDAARETYHQIIPNLNLETRQAVLDQLEQFSQQRSDLKPIITEISTKLTAAKLPISSNP